MKNKHLMWLIMSVAIMLLLPFLVVTFVAADAGMFVCFIMFFVINPIYSAVLGIFGGKNIKSMWYHPIILAVLFLIGIFIIFETFDIIFVAYAVVYLAIGIAFMLVNSKKQ